tara:strand:+ start:14808 stop:15644 length:837 start_codon:yes stop_codon:yes gene_type:complete
MNKINKTLIFIKNLTAIAILAAGSTQASTLAHWSYSGHDGPTNWANLANEYQLCGSGQNQSPIDIQSTVKSNLFKLNADYYNVPLQILNNGHTIQFNYSSISKTQDHQVSLDGKIHLLPSAKTYNSSLKISGEKYSLLQVHFHSPSEHQINGQHHSLEAHFVHANTTGQLAVVGVLFNEGEANSSISKLWEFMPGEAGAVKTIEGITINAGDLLPDSLAYYHYRGSLTTPPCSEAVRWFVLKAPQTVSTAQVKKFLSVVGENNRPVQPINARFLLKTE